MIYMPATKWYTTCDLYKVIWVDMSGYIKWYKLIHRPISGGWYSYPICGINWRFDVLAFHRNIDHLSFGWPRSKYIFAIPACLAGDTITEERASLIDETPENVIFLHSNQHLPVVVCRPPRLVVLIVWKLVQQRQRYRSKFRTIK